MHVPLSERFAVKISEAGQIIGVSVSSVYKMMRTGELETVKIAGRTNIKVESLRRVAGIS